MDFLPGKKKEKNNLNPNGTTKLPKALKDEFKNMAKSGHVPNYMDFVKKSDSDLIVERKNPNYDIHEIDLPARAMVVAPSGTGKTNLITHILNAFCQGEGTFATIQIVCGSKDEELYNFLQRRCPEIVITEGIETLPKLNTENFPKDQNHLIILDDLVLEKNQERIKKYYMCCRKFGVSIFYCSQKWTLTPLFIRQNATLDFLLDLGDDADVKRILKTMSLGIDKDTLYRVYKEATSQRGQPLRIDVRERDINKRFKKGLIGPIKVTDDESI